jgi:hypothetical protein
VTNKKMRDLLKKPTVCISRFGQTLKSFKGGNNENT